MVYIVVCKITNKSLSFLSDLRPKENNNKHHQGNAFIFDNKSKIYIYIYIYIYLHVEVVRKNFCFVIDKHAEHTRKQK
jgi:hypothetical protein